MTELTVRRLLIDLDAPFERDWCGGDAFRTAFFDALSLSFPVGEQFFIDSVRNGLQALPPAERARFEPEARGFIGQEATHRRIHSLFNAQLERQGLVNRWAGWATTRIRFFEGADPRHALATTAANEHFTALLAEWLLRNHDVLDGAEARLKTMWLWHSAEESEHRSTAFDLYQALGGSHEWRVRWFRRTTMFFLADAIRQTLDILRRKGQLWRWRTWTSAASFLLGRRGLLRECLRPWTQYLRRDFHPGRQDDALSRRWLAENAGAYVPVRGS